MSVKALTHTGRSHYLYYVLRPSRLRKKYGLADVSVEGFCERVNLGDASIARQRLFRLIRTIAILAACIVLADCSASSAPGPLPLTTTTQPYSGVSQQIPYTQQPYVGTLTLPAATSVVPQGDTFTLIASQTSFSALPTILNERRAAANTTTSIPLIYLQISASATTVLSAFPSFSINLPSSVLVSNGPFYIAFYDPTATSPAWNYAIEGPGLISGSTVTLTPVNVSPFTLQGGMHYFFCIYQQSISIASAAPSASAASSASPTASTTPEPSASATVSPIESPTSSATPTPAPTATPTPTPTATPIPFGVLGLTSNALSLNGVGVSYAKTTTLQETGYGGTFSENDTCSSIATIASSSNTGPYSTITVTGLASGSCSATFRDASNHSVTLNVSITVSGYYISMTTRHKEVS